MFRVSGLRVLGFRFVGFRALGFRLGFRALGFYRGAMGFLKKGSFGGSIGCRGLYRVYGLM